MRVSYANWLDDYTLVASSAAANLPATNLQDPRLSLPWRSTGDSAEWIKIDAGSGLTLNPTCLGIAGHNLSSGATIKVQGNATDAWTAPTVDVTVTWRAGTILHFFTGQALRFWRVSLVDASNPDTYIQIGRLSLGTFIEFPPVAPEGSLPRVTTSVASESLTGQVYGDRGITVLAPAFEFVGITDAERQAVDAMFIAVENVAPFFLVIWPDSLTVQGPIYCRINQDALGWKKERGEGPSWTLSIAFREVC